MNKKPKPIDWRAMNISAWLVVILAYVYPFRAVENGWIEVGFPFSFLTIYNHWQTNLLASLSLNPLGLFLNIVIVYLLISVPRSLRGRSKETDDPS